MRILSALLIFIFAYGNTNGQSTPGAAVSPTKTLDRPKLVVGIVVDQMRWDYLYRYYDRYQENGGFKRLLQNGFSCENTYIPYVPTLTACGHSSIYTGSVPAINGITGNDWFDFTRNKVVYCTGDDSVQSVGTSSTAGKMSPKNLLTSGVGDELRLATNFKGKVIGIAIKDRGAILPAGHSGNAAFWYDPSTGNWVSSSYYMNDLPQWQKDFNATKAVDKYMSKDWNTLYPLNTYQQGNADDKDYEAKPFGAGSKGFPYDLKQFVGKNYGFISVTPYGNSFSFDEARAAIAGEQLGADNITDLLTLSLSSPDYIGHTFGPNSVEAEDCFLRLDQDLGAFLDHLDEKVGKGSYLVFLTADHGAASIPKYLEEHKMPAGAYDTEKLDADLNTYLKSNFKLENMVLGIFNHQVILDRNALIRSKPGKDAVMNALLTYLNQQPGIYKAVPLESIMQQPLNERLKKLIVNGYFPTRSGDIQLIYNPQVIEGFMKGGTTHGSWNPYDSHIPLIWYGWKINPGSLNREVYMTDIAPTLSALLHIQAPNGSVGVPIPELIKP